MHVVPVGSSHTVPSTMGSTNRAHTSSVKPEGSKAVKAEHSFGKKGPGKETSSHSFPLATPITVLLLSFCCALVKDLLEDGEHASVTGASRLPVYLEPWLDLGITVTSMVTFTRLSSRLQKKTLFYTSVAFYLVFFFVSGCQLVWNWLHDGRHESLPDSSPRWASLQIHLRELIFRLAGRPFSSLLLWAIYRHVVVEVWGSVLVPVFFWGLVNKVHTFSCKFTLPALISLAFRLD